MAYDGIAPSYLRCALNLNGLQETMSTVARISFFIPSVTLSLHIHYGTNDWVENAVKKLAFVFYALIANPKAGYES